MKWMYLTPGDAAVEGTRSEEPCDTGSFRFRRERVFRS